MNTPRASGILLHPTSLPGRYGLGDLGPEAYRWIEFLAVCGQRLWQILPLGPTGYSDSPYQSFSAFAGNPLLISPDRLIEDGLLCADDLEGPPDFPAERVDFGPVIEYKKRLLDKAFERFAGAGPELRAEFEAFAAREAGWLDDFAMFMALKGAHGGAVWNTWDAALATREPAAMAEAARQYAPAVASQKFRQFLFFRQWMRLKTYANAKGIVIVGDVPIFVAYDSADVWARPPLFRLDASGQPTHVAGVPPDYFSPTGQLWGNPLYQWDGLKKRGYDWWIDRLRATLATVDIVRLDHFRGFEAYWEVPAGMPTAEVGRWVKGPGAHFFEAIRAALGDAPTSLSAGLPIIAEDLGVITPEVVALRDRFNLPGMKVLQFAFAGDPADPFLPHNFPRNCVAYSGTHDNDTSRGWYQTLSQKERDFYRRYSGRDGSDVSWDLIRLAWASVANMAVAPLQDVLSLGPEARMNLPGRASGNWSWRYLSDQLADGVRVRLTALTRLYGRGGGEPPDETRPRPGHHR
ncbi:MAG: 4-alpha-glucanotransferase [Chloroflexi bacterium]|nr:4-alpha-glucanotransferase [Chloroflexota bacterium]